jgi:hypothetical protein
VAEARRRFQLDITYVYNRAFPKQQQPPVLGRHGQKSSLSTEPYVNSALRDVNIFYELSAAAGGQQKERRRRPTPHLLIAHRPFLRLAVWICLFGSLSWMFARGMARRRAGGHPNRLNWIPRSSGRVPAGPSDYSGYL